MRITSDQNEYGFSKQPILVSMLKNKLFLRCFLTSFVDFYIMTAFETNYSSNFWMADSRFFIAELAFCECDKNHKFDNFKTHKNLFFNEVVFYFIRLLHYIKSVRISCIQPKCGKMWTRITLNTDTFYAVLCYKRC